MDYATHAGPGGELIHSDTYDMDILSSEFFFDGFLAGDDGSGLPAQAPHTSTTDQSHELTLQNFGLLSSHPSISDRQDTWTSTSAPFQNQIDPPSFPAPAMGAEAYSWEHGFAAPQVDSVSPLPCLCSANIANRLS